MKIALVHDQLQEFGGAERVFLALKRIFPQSDVFTSFYKESPLDKAAPDWKSWNLKTSYASKIPFFGKLYSPLRFLAPSIWESFDFSDYDLVISSSGWYMSKGIITKKPTVHISYFHHPPRYLYGYETAMEWQRYWPVRIYAHVINHGLRMWDFESAKRPDFYIVNSQETRRRLQKFYRRDATVIYPPVNIPKKATSYKLQVTNPYYIIISRIDHAKHVEVLVRAANKMKFRLKIAGSGRDIEHLKSIAGPTVEFLGRVDDSAFPKLYRGARAFLFSAVDEEFGIAPVEAMGYGVPVIAYKSGGLIETVKDGVNGYLFDELTPDSLEQKIKQLESLPKEDYLQMRKNARREAEIYSFQNFKKKILAFVKAHQKKADQSETGMTF